MTATAHDSLDRAKQEAERARASVSHELAEVMHRLEPEQLKQQIVDRARDAGSQFIRDRKQRLKETVLDTVMNNPIPTVGFGTVALWSIWRRVRNIPPPILLIGAGAIAGMMTRKEGASRSVRSADRDDYRSWEPEEPMRERVDAAAPGVGERAREAGARLREVAYAVGAEVSQTAGRAGSTASDAAARATSGVGRAANQAATTSSNLARQARSQISDLAEKHPLVLGSIGLALGAAIAASFRSTETEARLVGETSDRFKSRAREMAEAQFERAQSMAERAYEAARHEAR